MTVDYLPRSAWGARSPKAGPGPLDPHRVEGVAFHWPGTESHTPITSKAAVASALRGWQAFHMDDRGWSDIAYQVAVDQAGRAWTLRGLRTQSGANGDQDVNETYGAILLVLVQGEEPSDAMKATARAVVADFREQYPHGTAVKGHRDVRPGGTPDHPSTDCPGPAAYAALKRGELNPTTTTQEDWFDMAKPEEIRQAVHDGVLGALQDYGKALFADEKGTADTLVDEARAHRAAELTVLGKIADAVTKP